MRLSGSCGCCLSFFVAVIAHFRVAEVAACCVLYVAEVAVTVPTQRASEWLKLCCVCGNVAHCPVAEVAGIAWSCLWLRWRPLICAQRASGWLKLCCVCGEVAHFRVAEVAGSVWACVWRVWLRCNALRCHTCNQAPPHGKGVPLSLSIVFIVSLSLLIISSSLLSLLVVFSFCAVAARRLCDWA